MKNVTKQLGIEDLFDGIFAITDADFVPKPNIESYKKMIKKFDLDPKKSAFNRRYCSKFRTSSKKFRNENMLA